MAKKKNAAETCPKCGCPELMVCARETLQGLRVQTTCMACGHVIRPTGSDQK